jgi:hypothetical protein
MINVAVGYVKGRRMKIRNSTSSPFFLKTLYVELGVLLPGKEIKIRRSTGSVLQICEVDKK